jgi:hypothetical protein
MTSVDHLLLGDRHAVWPELEGDSTGFRDQKAVNLAAAMWPKVKPIKYAPARAKLVHGDGLFGDTPHPPAPLELTERRFGYLEITPGTLRVRWSRHPAEGDPDRGIHGADCDCDHCRAFVNAGTCPVCDAPGGLCDECGDSVPAVRVISDFSAKAKLRMMSYIAAVDWASQRYPDENLLFLDLTYPDNWSECVPTPADAQAQFKTLCQRFKRATGRPLRCVWVREFQRRGAPHFHLLVLWPRTIKGRPSKLWLSRNWYQIVGSGDPKHLAAGTRINFEEALRGAVDPKRAAAYFAGYCEKDKAYQHEAPEAWTNPNGSVGAFWGHRGLVKATAEIGITPEVDIEIRRMMRRYVASQKRVVERKVARQVARRYASVTSGETITPIDFEALTLEERIWWQPIDLPGSFRKVRRRWRLKSLTPAGPAADGERGFMVFVNDAPLLATQLARYLTQLSTTTWPKGERRPLP